jgi:hypothetical protein
LKKVRTPSAVAFSVWISLGVLLVSVLFEFSNPKQAGALVSDISDANQLVGEVVQNEVQSQVNDHNLWSYRERRTAPFIACSPKMVAP